MHTASSKLNATMGTRQLFQVSWAALLLLSLPQLAAGALDMEAPSPPSSWNRDASLPRKWMKAGTTTAFFCGSACCCSAEDDLKLREAFLNEVKAHGYEDADCRSQLKAYICAVCLPPAPACDPFSNTTASRSITDDNSSLPLGCAAWSASASVSVHYYLPSPSTETPTTPDQWLPADDGNKSWTPPKWLIALIFIGALLLFAMVTYVVCLRPTPHIWCCHDSCKIYFCVCWPYEIGAARAHGAPDSENGASDES